MISVSGPIEITRINNSVRFMAGYCTDDHFQHVVAASNDGYVYHVTWGPGEVGPGGYQPPADRLGHFDGLATIAGFFTSKDHYYHAVAGTQPDRNLHELYYNLGGNPIIAQRRNLTDPNHYHINPGGFDDSKGMASFYSRYDHLGHEVDLRHVVIVDGNGHPVDITWNANTLPKGKTITILSHSRIASISGFLATDDNSRHIIVALKTGEIYDIDYPDEAGVPSTVDENSVKTTFTEQVQNVTAFFSSDNNYRHIVVLTKENLLIDRSYDRNGAFLIINPLNPHTPLPGDVADITSFYNAHDRLCHVLYATKDGNLKEFTYTSH